MFEIQRYNTTDQSAWDTFVPLGNNGTLFHLRAFFNYHPENRFTDHSLLIKKRGKLFSVFPSAEKKIGDTTHLVSHPGASIGSFVVRRGSAVQVRKIPKICHVLGTSCQTRIAKVIGMTIESRSMAVVTTTPLT